MNKPTSISFNDFKDVFDAVVKGGVQILQLVGGERRLGICYGKGFKGVPEEVEAGGVGRVGGVLQTKDYCSESYGVPPSLSDHTQGDPAEVLYLRNERVVAYKPYLHFLGSDSFTYQIFDGVNVQRHISQSTSGQTENQITINVKNCRIMNYNLQFNISSPIYQLCVCSQSDTSFISDITKCESVRKAVCQSSEKNHFFNMCSACYSNDQFIVKCINATTPTATSTPTTTSNNTTSNTTTNMNNDKLNVHKGKYGQCLSETIRAVSMITVAGLCSHKPYMDCTTENIPSPGLDRIDYLSLKYPIENYREYSQLGIPLVGGTGWFGSATSDTSPS